MRGIAIGFVFLRTRAARGRRVAGLAGPPGEAAASGRKMALYFWSPSFSSWLARAPFSVKTYFLSATWPTNSPNRLMLW